MVSPTRNRSGLMFFSLTGSRIVLTMRSSCRFWNTAPHSLRLGRQLPPIPNSRIMMTGPIVANEASHTHTGWALDDLPSLCCCRRTSDAGLRLPSLLLTSIRRHRTWRYTSGVTNPISDLHHLQPFGRSILRDLPIRWLSDSNLPAWRSSKLRREPKQSSWRHVQHEVLHRLERG